MEQNYEKKIFILGINNDIYESRSMAIGHRTG